MTTRTQAPSSRVALVTGASVAHRLADQGHRLVLIDRNLATVADTHDDIIRAGGDVMT
jgi:NAD(P)-dependent dehydrogenase (short-subunit alcohol dehydrogenase family)